MYWTLKLTRENATPVDSAADGRFVLHRHRDALGPHFDLRLEQDGVLVGWRIDGESLDGSLWATEKAPHPLRWLDVDGEAIRAFAGEYRWMTRDAHGASLQLHAAAGCWLVEAERVAGLTPSAVRSIAETLGASGFEDDDAARLVADGIAARRRAVERLCGLGRELDGAAFDETIWRRVSHSLSLDEIHAQLRSYEVRFDAKYPPSPVSRPEPLGEDESGERLESALAIARG